MNNKIIFYTVSHPKYGLGGAELQTYYLAKEFAIRSWDVYFLTERKNYKSNFNDNFNKITVVEYERGNNILKTAFNIFLKLIEIRPNFIYYRYHKFHLGVLAIYSSFFNSKLFWNPMHDEYCDDSAPIKVSYKKMQKEKRKLKKIFWKIKLYFERRLFLYGVKKTNGIMVQNKIQNNIVKNNFANKKVLRIYNGHYIHTFENKKKYDIIFVATLKEFKRPELFFEIIKRISFLVKVAMVGNNFSDDLLAARVRDAISELNINYYGEVEPEKVLQLTSVSKILINTSINEGFPNTFIQAWMLGVPVVSLKVDPDNLIRENGLGIVCDDNVAYAAEKIEELLGNEHEYSVLSNKCKNFANENFNIKTNSLKLENFMLGN